MLKILLVIMENQRLSKVNPIEIEVQKLLDAAGTINIDLSSAKLMYSP